MEHIVTPADTDQQMFDMHLQQLPPSTREFYQACSHSRYGPHYRKLLLRYMQCEGTPADIIRMTAFNLHFAAFDLRCRITRAISPKP